MTTKDELGSEREQKMRRGVARAFSLFEDAVYIGLGLILAYSGAVLLITAGVLLVRSATSAEPVGAIIDLLDRSLLVLMIVELLYTVKVSFREHALVPEPFLVVGLIAVTRRILVITADFAHLVDKPETLFRRSMIEAGLLTVMVLALVASLRMLRQRTDGAGRGSATPVK